MTRRLALSILVIVWTTLIAGGGVAYLATRSLLLEDLDATLIARARSLPELSDHAEAAARVEEAAGDRYVISNELGQTRGRLAELRAPAPPPAIMHAALATLGDGRRVRTLSLRFTPLKGGKPISVVYSSSADRLDAILRRLAIALAVFGLATGAMAAGIAVRISRQALLPLRATVDTIGQIDERHLERRIDAASLPPELQPLARRLNEMLSRLQENFGQRKQFLADASHELRTPVAALITTLEVALRRPRDARELTEILQSCLSDARMLRQLVQTLLQHARDDARALLDVAERFDAAELLDQCCNVADGLALEKDVSVRRHYDRPIWMDSQPKRLRGIVMNLLGNGIEYNRAGGSVELSVEGAGNELALVVRDTGCGIAPEHQSQVMQPFFRVPGRPGLATHEENHLGLGLFLVDSHVKALGGRIEIDSKLGVGTTFCVRIPGRQPSPPAVTPMRQSRVAAGN